MVIVSQDKKMLVNFNNIVSVYVIENYISEEKGFNGYNIDFATDEEINFVLATYKTEERANKIFQQLIGGLQNESPIYYMPEDKEG